LRHLLIVLRELRLRHALLPAEAFLAHRARHSSPGADTLSVRSRLPPVCKLRCHFIHSINCSLGYRCLVESGHWY
jgi:hypothetical protein